MTALAAAVAALVEAVLVGVRAGTDSTWATAALEASWTLGVWLLPCALGACVAAVLLALLCDEESLLELGRRRLSDSAGRDAAAVTLGGAASLLAWVYVTARAAHRFRNVELASLLVAALSACGALLLAAVAVRALRALERRRRAERPFPALAAAVGASALTLGWLLFEARDGLVQLDGRLLGAPLGFAAAFVLGDRSLRVRSCGTRGALVGAALAALTCVAWVRSPARAVAALAEHGAWTPRVIGALRAVSDFDRDGYSSLLGGGDCAAFDSAVHPGRAEVSGDGVDNNCIGGDGGKAALPRRPSWGAAAHGSPSNLNVVIVTIETLRHDHASFVRAARDTTPNLRALAGESLVFERMYSAAPLTRLSLATLFSSYAPSEIDWQPLPAGKRMRRIGPRTPWLPELLAARGYETIAVLTDFSAFTAQEDAGFERGFRRYDTSTKMNYRGGTMWGFPAAEQVDKALGHLKQARTPFLLWLHLFEPHYTYEQPPDAPRFGDDERARYDAEIWHADRQLGRLIAGLRELGVWDKTVLLATGDHGEAFGEHDDRWHGSNLFDPQLRPAALLRIPGMPGKRVDVSVGFSDLAPTLARVLGDRASFEQLRGRSLTPLLHRRRLPDDDNLLIAESFSVDDGQAYQAAVISYPLKLIYVEAGRRFSLFDLSADPRERRPIEPKDDQRAAPLMVELIGYLERTRPRSLSRR